MPRLSQAEIRNNAISFVHEWKDETSERAESQTFWNEFFEVFGLKRRSVAIFEKAVKRTSGNFGKIDLFWKSVVLVEHKSAGENLDKATSQAFRYLEHIDEAEHPQYVLISDFAHFRLYDLETGAEYHFPLAKLSEKIQLFGFISGYQKREYREQDPVNIKVALKLGDLHDALLESGYDGHKLEAFLVRLVYCLFADDTGIFTPRESLLRFLEHKTAEDGSNTGAMLGQLFQVLDTPDNQRAATLDDDLRAFQYVNGALFRDRFDMPFFDARMRRLLIEACRTDWSKVSPAIFGSLFQSVMDKDKRRNLGAHYTSEKNILKVIHGLFLDELLAEFENVKNNLTKLRAFHNKLATLRFFDPACGCGNFLVITYREMRRLELSVLKQIRSLTGNTQGQMLVSSLSKIDVNSFYGIEYEEFPAEIARVALWVTDHLANIELSDEFGVPYFRLPLEHAPNIVHGNALRWHWPRIFDFEVFNNLYILGNPPFVGKDKRSDEQTADMESCCSAVNNFKTLDYVCAWYIKAAEFLDWSVRQDGVENGSPVRVAFVSTNSITQGEQVGILWQYLLDRGVKIHFAHRTFKWSNEASGKAAVYCVIVGFGLEDAKKKRLFDYETPKSEAHELLVKNINPYLVDASDTVVTSRRTPICDAPEMIYGNKPVDGGFLFLNGEAERTEFLAKEPNAAKFVRRIYGSEEFINRVDRYCLWLKDANPSEWRSLPEVVGRVQGVRNFRLKSTKAATVRLAEIPYLFAEIRQPDSDFLIVPLTSSENRRYVPIGFFPKEFCVNNLVSIVPNATLFHFGVLTSTMHNAWMRQVCGRLESRYRYSNNLVYNNFPFPRMSEPPSVTKNSPPYEGGVAPASGDGVVFSSGSVQVEESQAENHPVGETPTPLLRKEGSSEKKRLRVEQTAQAILDARLKFPDATLADLYDPLSMPKELLDAHRANDEAVDACYGSKRFKNELERLEFLFDLYRQYTEPLAMVEERETRKSKRSKKL